MTHPWPQAPNFQHLSWRWLCIRIENLQLFFAPMIFRHLTVRHRCVSGCVRVSCCEHRLRHVIVICIVHRFAYCHNDEPAPPTAVTVIPYLDDASHYSVTYTQRCQDAFHCATTIHSLSVICHLRKNDCGRQSNC